MTNTNPIRHRSVQHSATSAVPARSPGGWPATGGWPITTGERIAKSTGPRSSSSVAVATGTFAPEWLEEALRLGDLRVLATPDQRRLATLSGTHRPLSAEVTYQGQVFRVVLKRSGDEDPRWQSVRGVLALREAAAYNLDRSLGLGLVPPTVLRRLPDGSLASVQLYVPNLHLLTNVPGMERLLHGSSSAKIAVDQVERLILFDVLIGNPDRPFRGGSNFLLARRDDETWCPVAVDNGSTMVKDGRYGDPRVVGNDPEHEGAWRIAADINHTTNSAEGVPLLTRFSKSTIEFVMSIDPEAVAVDLAQTGLGVKPVESLLFRLVALQNNPDIVFDTQPFPSPSADDCARVAEWLQTAGMGPMTADGEAEVSRVFSDTWEEDSSAIPSISEGYLPELSPMVPWSPASPRRGYRRGGR